MNDQLGADIEVFHRVPVYEDIVHPHVPFDHTGFSAACLLCYRRLNINEAFTLGTGVGGRILICGQFDPARRTAQFYFLCTCMDLCMANRAGRRRFFCPVVHHIIATVRAGIRCHFFPA